MNTIGSEQPLGVDTDIVVFDQVRPGNVLRFATDDEAYQLTVTRVVHELDAMATPTMATTVKAAGFVCRGADPEGRYFGFEPLLTEIGVIGSCQTNGLLPVDSQEVSFASTIAQGVAGRLVLGHYVLMIDCSGHGQAHLTGPLTSLNWLAASAG